MTDVEADGVISETLALRKELGSGSDVKGEQDGGSGFGEAWVTSMFLGECAIQFQDYSEARVISMMTVEFQATVLR
ncbi:Rna Cytidine Acetyltransferase [Manis pentadactyla]|nr:Rna Cytidine Acetyltransferase [Manis pentadactyla]